MADPIANLDMFARGIAAGAVLVTGASARRSGLSRSAEVATLMLCASIACWVVTESDTLWSSFGRFFPIVIPAFSGGGLFWLFVLTVFEDRRISLANLAPTLILTATGFLVVVIPHGVAKDALWVARNTFSGLLCLHAAILIAGGWSGDLLEGRRRMRGAVIAFAAAFAVLNVVLAFVARLDPGGPWLLFTVGQAYGGAILALVVVAAGATFLQARPIVFATRRAAANVADGRTEAADRAVLDKLNGFMAGGGWRQEGLTIGAVAATIGEPAHRVRRLINQRLGHRNFIDFVNGYRIEAAKQRLADPAEVRTTVAAIAFDLGYGSLGPFNRAFRAATAATPTEWRRQALAAVASPELKEAS